MPFTTDHGALHIACQSTMARQSIHVDSTRRIRTTGMERTSRKDRGSTGGAGTAPWRGEARRPAKGAIATPSAAAPRAHGRARGGSASAGGRSGGRSRDRRDPTDAPHTPTQPADAPSRMADGPHRRPRRAARAWWRTGPCSRRYPRDTQGQAGQTGQAPSFAAPAPRERACGGRGATDGTQKTHCKGDGAGRHWAPLTSHGRWHRGPGGFGGKLGRPARIRFYPHTYIWNGLGWVRW